MPITVRQLRAHLARLDQDAEVMITTAPRYSHGCFAVPIDGVVMNRTVREKDADGVNAERPVVVLHYKGLETGRAWCAKAHGKPAESKVAATVFYDNNQRHLVVRKGATIPTVWSAEAACSAWRHRTVDVFFYGDGDEIRSDYEELVFSNEDEAKRFASFITGMVIVELHKR